jgi:hypothetical protein
MSTRKEKQLLDAFLSLADKVDNKEEAEEIASLAELEVCVVCKDSDLPPSEYLKTYDNFKKHGYDNILGGKVCDTCLKEEIEFDREGLE